MTSLVFRNFCFDYYSYRFGLGFRLGLGLGLELRLGLRISFFRLYYEMSVRTECAQSLFLVFRRSQFIQQFSQNNWVKVFFRDHIIFKLSAYSHSLVYIPGVSLSMSRHFFGSSATHVWACVCSLLSDLSYSSNLALTLMSACIRGARVHAHSYTVAEILKTSRWLILNDIPYWYCRPSPSQIFIKKNADGNTIGGQVQS